MIKSIVLVSGSLGYKCLEHLSLNPNVKIQTVFTDKNSVSIIEYCKSNNIQLFVGNPRSESASNFISNLNFTDYIFSINYLFLINENLINKAKKLAINFHGSLLPKYRGRTPHVWAIINNEKFTGITAHVLTKNCDEGDIIFSKKIKILKTYTGADILEIYFKVYPDIMDQILSIIFSEKISLVPQNNKIATYYGKRTPDDGLIDWNWQRERIYNWIRAQAPPYPGAFSKINENIINIFKVKFSNLGYSNDIENGTIIKVKKNSFIVKCPNGAIEVLIFKCNIKLSVGLKFV